MGRALVILACILLAAVAGFIISMTQWQIATNVVVGVVALVLTMVSLEIGLGLTIFLVPLTLQQEVGKLVASPVHMGSDDFLMGCMLLGALVNMARTKRVFWVRSPLNAPFMAFFAACLLSLSYIISHRGFGPAFNLSLLHLLKWYEPISLYFLVVASVVRREQIVRYILAGMAGALAVVVLQFTQHQIGPASTGDLYQLPSGQLVYRTTAGFGSESVLGSYYVLVLGVTLALIFVARHSRTRWLLRLFGGVVSVGLLLTYNRASYLGALVMLTTLMLLSRRRWSYLALLVGAVVLVSCIPSASERLSMTIHGGGLGSRHMQFDESAMARFGLWGRAVQLFLRSPIIGVGFWGQRSMGLFGATAHSQYLTLLMDTGILGAAAFFWIFWRILTQADHLRRTLTDPLAHAVTIGVMAGICGILVHAVFGESFDSFRLTSPLWFFTGLVMAIRRMELQPATPAAPASPAAPAPSFRPRLVVR